MYSNVANLHKQESYWEMFKHFSNFQTLLTRQVDAINSSPFCDIFSSASTENQKSSYILSVCSDEQLHFNVVNSHKQEYLLILLILLIFKF